MADFSPTTVIRCACLLAALLWPHLAAASSDACERAASEAAVRSGVPESILLAITLTETGRESGGLLRPWPWTINNAGEGHWFATAQEAEVYAARAAAEGKTNFDIGCFQLNHRWHSAAFASAGDMLDPLANALYAGRLLADHYGRAGDWSVAAGAYHSATPEFADRYRARFDEILAGLAEVPDAEPRQIASLGLRENRFPLLNGGAGSAGSLVPLQTGGRRLIGN